MATLNRDWKNPAPSPLTKGKKPGLPDHLSQKRLAPFWAIDLKSSEMYKKCVFESFRVKRFVRDEGKLPGPLAKFRKKSRTPEGSPRIYSRGAMIWEGEQTFFIIPPQGAWICLSMVRRGAGWTDFPWNAQNACCYILGGSRPLF